jgi:ferritin-like metal-binding protein YciE
MASDFFTIKTLHNLADYDAMKLAGAETQLINILPDWIGKAGPVSLKVVLEKYQDYIRQHRQKILDYYKERDSYPFNRTNNIMQAFILETREKLNNCMDIEVRDACLLSCVQGINHYKISMYGTAAAFAKSIGDEKLGKVFYNAEQDEKEIDNSLSKLAKQEINTRARAPIVLGSQGN